MLKRVLFLVSVLLCLSMAVPTNATSPAARRTPAQTQVVMAAGSPAAFWQNILDTIRSFFVRHTPEPVQIEFWHGLSPSSEAGQALETLVIRYNESQRQTIVRPIYQGSYSDLNRKFQAGYVADLSPAIIHGTSATLMSLSRQGMIMPLDGVLPPTERADYPANLLESYTYDGRLHGLPFNQSSFVMIYDRKQVPTPPRTWDEFQATAQKISSSGPMAGTVFNADVYAFGIYLHQAGGQWVAGGKPAFNSEAGVKALTFMEELVRTGAGRMLKQREYATNAFNDGQVAMIITTSSSLPYITPKFGQDWGVAPLPAGPKNGNGGMAGAGLAIASNLPAEERKAATDFLLWLTGKEATVEWAMAGTGYLPVRTSALSDPTWTAYTDAHPAFAVAAAALPTAHPTPNVSWWSTAQREITMAVEYALLGRDRPKEALDAAAQRLNAFPQGK